MDKTTDMLDLLPGGLGPKIKNFQSSLRSKRTCSSLQDIKRGGILATPKTRQLAAASIMVIVLLSTIFPIKPVSEKVISPHKPLTPLMRDAYSVKQNQNGKEVFGFAPYWTINKLSTVDFNTLTTLAYFDAPIDGNGDIDRTSQGYITFKSDKATELFETAHAHNTKVVLTVTQMHAGPILALMDSDGAQANAISQIVDEVQSRGIDGINVDLEMGGDPGYYYRNRFTELVDNLTDKMHEANPDSQVTVSVYAASVKDPKLYDIAGLAGVTDGIFMMAYDFAPAGADNAIPTAPMYGYRDGTYWYDVSTAVDDFLTQMPADKLILGVPWYGYNYPVESPEIKSATLSAGISQTYAAYQDNINPSMDASFYTEGWDDVGKVGWRAYTRGGAWRMVFTEDHNSLGIKADFAQAKNLAGIGIWALGFDAGYGDLWNVIRNKFGIKLTQVNLKNRAISGEASL